MLPQAFHLTIFSCNTCLLLGYQVKWLQNLDYLVVYMQSNQFSLLKKRKFLPLFLAQLTGASHDNIFKNAIIVLLIFGVGKLNPESAKLLATLA